MKKLVFILSVLLLTVAATDVQAQWLKNLGQKAVDRAKDRAKEKVEKKVDDAVDRKVDSVFDETENAVKGKEKKDKNNESESNESAGKTSANNGTATDPQNQPAPQTRPEQKAPELSWNAFDFVPGDEVIFDDNQTREQLGEFPSRWDLIEGEAEIARFDGTNVLCLRNECILRPLMKNLSSYLGDVFTIELDYYFTLEKENEDCGEFKLHLIPADKDWHGYSTASIELPAFVNDWYWERREQDDDTGKVNYRYWWNVANDQQRFGERLQLLAPNQWLHLSISFNKRAMKIYINENRIANIPNMTPNIGWMQLSYSGATEGTNGYVKNIRIARGAVPLYDRMLTDGKFITYGITFDVGKSVIKPESMGEINRIVRLMTDNPELRFSVEGHTDSTGNPASNQTLSEARSRAIVSKLTELGIPATRLTSAGKGQNNPIADNNTDEGRSKNRRVEFVKM